MEYEIPARGDAPTSIPGRRELSVKAKCVADNDTLISHIHSALDRGLQEFQPTLKPHDGECIIVGSGPTVRHYPEKIRKLASKPGTIIISVKAGHDFLLEKGIVPHYGLMVDPRTHITKYFKMKRDDIKYLIASQVHPEVFDYFSDNNVILWHLLAGSLLEAFKLKGINCPSPESPWRKGDPFPVGGGSTSGLRAICLAFYMGFRKVHLFGFDSSFYKPFDTKYEVDEFIRRYNENRDSLGAKTNLKISGDKPVQDVVALEVENKFYVTDLPMAAQADEFQKIVAMLNGMKYKVYGKALVPDIAKAMRNTGHQSIRKPSEPW